MRNPIPPDDEAPLRAQAAAKRRESARLSRTCRCGAYFEKLSDKLVHISIECPLRGTRRLRTVSCYGCAADIDVNVTRTCGACGFTLPDHDGSNPLPKWQPLTKE